MGGKKTGGVRATTPASAMHYLQVPNCRGLKLAPAFIFGKGVESPTPFSIGLTWNGRNRTLKFLTQQLTPPSEYLCLTALFFTDKIAPLSGE
jgi:hypothetical protein